MDNFLQFLKRDINAKQDLISAMPTRTVTNKKKLNATLEAFQEKYEEYLSGLKKYMVAKKKAIKVPEDKDIDGLMKKVEELERVCSLLNPYNTYMEKMGFDSLFYELDNYYTFNFNSLNEIINGFLDGFEKAEIFLKSEDFDYTSYVHEYMMSFLEVRRSNSGSYQKVSEIFEQIYWVNPEIIEHIGLNFRKLIRKNEKKFNQYIAKLQSEVKSKYGVDSYALLLKLLKDAQIDYDLLNKESIKTIVDLALNGAYDIEHYREGNKVRISSFNSLLPDDFNWENKEAKEKLTVILEKLSANMKEYEQYLEFTPLFVNFKNQYMDVVAAEKKEEKSASSILVEINKKEEELEKIHQKIYGGRRGFLEVKTEKNLKVLKTESLYVAKELSALYKTYDEEYFKDKVLMNISKVMTISDLLTLYYSFDYFKKRDLQKAYNLEDYKSILDYAKKFDVFAQNTNNLVVTGIPIFENVDVPRIIANKYRLHNLKINEVDLEEGNLKATAGKVNLVLRVKKIEESSISLDKIWFIVQCEKLFLKDK